MESTSHKYNQRVHHQAQKSFKDSRGQQVTVFRLDDGYFVCPHCNEFRSHDPDKIPVSTPMAYMHCQRQLTRVFPCLAPSQKVLTSGEC